LANATLGAPALNLSLLGLKMAGALLIVLALMGGIYFLLKRFGPKTLFKPQNNEYVEILCAYPLGPKKSLLVVRFLNKKLLIGVAEDKISLLSEEKTDHAQKFDQLLSQENLSDN